MMAGIRGRNTKPEMIVRRGLHALGYRYRLHDRSLPGRPDLVFPARKAAIFVNGCFWHGHNCHLFRWPGTRQEFWREKISGNVSRDERCRQSLLEQDWRVAEVWECQLKGRQRLSGDEVISQCAVFLMGDQEFVSIGGSDRIAARAA